MRRGCVFPYRDRIWISSITPPQLSHLQAVIAREPSSSRTVRPVPDDDGSLAITAWRCESCGGVIEEIQILSRYGKTQPRRIRYAVAQERRTRWLAPFALHCATRD